MKNLNLTLHQDTKKKKKKKPEKTKSPVSRTKQIGSKQLEMRD